MGKGFALGCIRLPMLTGEGALGSSTVGGSAAVTRMSSWGGHLSMKGGQLEPR